MAFAAFAFSCGDDDKPKGPSYNGLQGIEIGVITKYPTRVDENGQWVPFWVGADHPKKFGIDYTIPEEPRDAVLETVRRGVDQALRLARQHHPEWESKLPPVKEFHIYAIKPMAFTEDGLPALTVTAHDSSGRVIGTPVKTAGTVFNVKQSITPRPESLTNPFIVIAYQENWDRLDYLFNQVWFESEHLIERWISYQEFTKYAGANDVHPHRPDTAAPARLVEHKSSTFYDVIVEGPAEFPAIEIRR